MLPVEEKDEQNSFWQSNYNLCNCGPADTDLLYQSNFPPEQDSVPGSTAGSRP